MSPSAVQKTALRPTVSHGAEGVASVQASAVYRLTSKVTLMENSGNSTPVEPETPHNGTAAAGSIARLWMSKIRKRSLATGYSIAKEYHFSPRLYNFLSLITFLQVRAIVVIVLPLHCVGCFRNITGSAGPMGSRTASCFGPQMMPITAVLRPSSPMLCWQRLTKHRPLFDTVLSSSLRVTAVSVLCTDDIADPAIPCN
jgi:hypothetical protein